MEKNNNSDFVSHVVATNLKLESLGVGVQDLKSDISKIQEDLNEVKNQYVKKSDLSTIIELHESRCSINKEVSSIQSSLDRIEKQTLNKPISSSVWPKDITGWFSFFLIGITLLGVIFGIGSWISTVEKASANTFIEDQNIGE